MSKKKTARRKTTGKRQPARRPKGVRTGMRKRYSWHEHARAFLKLDAQACGEALDALIEKHGQQMPAEVVVAEATQRSSPLHDAFPWDDKKAAREFRLEVARRLLRSYKVTFVYEGGEEIQIRATVSTGDPGQPGGRVYSTVDYALADPELREKWIHAALTELMAARRKYAQLQELAMIFMAIDGAAKEHERRSNKSRRGKPKPPRGKR